MEGDRKRKTYDKEFKLDAVRLIVEEGRSVASVARDLGVNENSLHHWKKKYAEDGKEAFPGHGKLKPEDEELRRLKPSIPKHASRPVSFICCATRCTLHPGRTVKHMPRRSS